MDDALALAPLAVAAPSQRLPRAPAWDATLALIADPYRWIGRTCARLGSDAFEARLLLRPTIFLSGAGAARLFYDERRFQREGAAPEPLRTTLFGSGTVQGLDGPAHRQRKAVFVAALRPESVLGLVHGVRMAWLRAVPRWRGAQRVNLYHALQPILTEAVCGWAGVPLAPHERQRRAAQLAALFDGAAAGPWRHLRARWCRMLLEGWLGALVVDTRNGSRGFAPGSVAESFASERGPDGTPLPPRVAAAELLNLLRPVVAASLYMSFVAHALVLHPAEREALAQDGSPSDAIAFVQEVRRHYPFVPAVVARVREGFEHAGFDFPRGRRVLLDLYGTNHDPRVWNDPWRFSPARFHCRPPGAFELVPQGGGNAATQHRCPGEDVVLQLMLLSLDMLQHRLRWHAPPQDLALRMNRLPAQPRDGLVLGIDAG